MTKRRAFWLDGYLLDSLTRRFFLRGHKYTTKRSAFMHERPLVAITPYFVHRRVGRAIGLTIGSGRRRRNAAVFDKDERESREERLTSRIIRIVVAAHDVRHSACRWRDLLVLRQFRK